MKKILAIAALLFATSAMAAVGTTVHNLAGATGNGVCQYCHMPHNANTALAGVPIWARQIGTNITAYTSTRLGTANLGTTSFSLLCMSCHDGVTGLGQLWNGQALTVGAVVSLPPGDINNLGTSLTNDHPVGYSYPTAGTAATSSGLGTLASATGFGYVFFGASNFIECGSCHDPHIGTSTVTTAATYRFKRAVTATDFCAGCHSTK